MSLIGVNPKKYYFIYYSSRVPVPYLSKQLGPRFLESGVCLFGARFTALSTAWGWLGGRNRLKSKKAMSNDALAASYIMEKDVVSFKNTLGYEI